LENALLATAFPDQDHGLASSFQKRIKNLFQQVHDTSPLSDPIVALYIIHEAEKGDRRKLVFSGEAMLI